MSVLTNFEDLLERIKNITTPYEYYSFKKIYEDNKDQLTHEQQEFVEREYKNKASVLNLKNYERKIRDGAIIITIGIDLTNSGKIGDINFEKFKKYIGKGKEILPIDDQQLLDLSSAERWLNFSSQDINKNIREYIIDMKKDEIDINLLYLSIRKNIVLTIKGREGFTHIRFFNKNLNFYDIEELNSVIFSFKNDEKNGITYVVNKDNAREKVANVRKTYMANVKGYLHVDLDENDKDESKNTISRVATVTFVIEHLPKNDDFDCDYFLRNVKNLCIEWENENNSEEKKIENDIENICKDKYIRKVRIQYNNKEEIKEAVNFYDFLFLNIWNEIIYPTRRNISKLNKEVLNPNKFLEKIKRETGFIIFENPVLIFDKTPEMENYKIQEYPDYFIEMLLDFYGGRSYKEYLKGDIEEFKENAVVFGRAILYTRYDFSIFSRDSYNMKYFYENRINLRERGTRWAISWAILLGDMVTTSATYFILHNAEIEEHLSKKKSVKELKKITQKAIFDFEYYYDVDVVSWRSFRIEFEIAKRNFNLDYYHGVLKDRLQLFSTYEIAQENKRITYLIVLLTVVLIVLAIVPHYIKF